MNKLKVLAILPVSIAGRLIVSSIIDGLRQNNVTDICIFDELFENDLKLIIQKNFDLIIGYDFSPLKIKIDNNLDLKCICYFADNITSTTSGPEWEKYYPYLGNKDVYTFFWDKAMIAEYDFKNLFYLPQFTNFDIYKNNNCVKEFDVMFAGRLDTDIRLNLFVDLMKELPELNFAWFAIERHYKDALNRTEYKDLIKNCYRGFIDNEEDMATATNKSKIVVTMNSQGISSLNYRTVQTVACKTLLISDYRDELSLYDGNLPFYKDVKDLANKIKFYLSNEEEYTKTVNICHQIARKNHHSKENVEFMLKKALITNT